MVELELPAERQDQRLDAIFHALADSTRRTMLQLLAQGDCSVGELGAPFRMSFAGASKHVKTLERAGLVSRGSPGMALLSSVSQRSRRNTVSPMERA
ncbi:ArsR/SmtB family transcription factor [Variovorax sp. CT11-76]